ncbi:MAG TPA: EGF domain-containing protein, partial [Kofleriaceae bacterium]|nr:EGF domain-containing protein [Kofleriaceae bacterium]
MRCRVALLLSVLSVRVAIADALPISTNTYAQDWTYTSLLYVADDWTNVRGYRGYLGQDITTSTGADPQTLLAESVQPNDVDLIPNQTDPSSLATGGVAEFEIADPVVALRASSTADAPNLVINVSTRGRKGIAISYVLRDIDASAADAITPVALQYRVGSTGLFTNVPAAFVADATEGPSLAGNVITVGAPLPSAVDDKDLVQLRIITANAGASNEWVGVDNIAVTSAYSTFSAYCALTYSMISNGMTLGLAVVVSPDGNPVSTGITVACDLSEIGGAVNQPLYDDGTHGDSVSGNNIFSFDAIVAATVRGQKTMPCSIADEEMHSATCSFSLDVEICGDGLLAPNAQIAGGCDDGNTANGDGCDSFCRVEQGWTCSGEPSTCGDLNECAYYLDNHCVFADYCTDIVGGYTCACPPGYVGDGNWLSSGCTDIDECAANNDDCIAPATCVNTAGGYTCACPTGYGGDGRASGTGCSDIDECATNTDRCAYLAQCTNTIGGYTCTCPPGYGGTAMDLGGCEDINECTAGTDDCAADATCTNTQGSFTCTCNAGYYGNGRSCIDVDECASQTDNCS